MKIILLFSFGLFINQAILAQHNTSNFDRIDLFAISLPDTCRNSDILAEQLTKNYSDDLSKARAIYYWIIENIKYDKDLAFGKKKAYAFEYDADFFFIMKKTTCVGYSDLFAQMCMHVGIKCFPISGYLKGAYSIENVYLHTNHMWNVIQIDDQWYHLDATFDAYEHQYGNDSLDFLMTFDQLKRNRLPANPMWQFRSNPITLQYFDSECIQIITDDIPFWNYTDSIDNFIHLKKIDRELYNERQSFIYNPYAVIVYGMILIEKGDSIHARDFKTTNEWVKNDQLARKYYYDALKYLNPNIPVYLKDEVVYYRAKRVKEYRKEATQKIKDFEDLNKSMPYYID